MALTLALLAATALRAAPLTDNRFHPDEALYASFGKRIASGHDPLLSGVVVDKPPLPFYLLALSLGALGGGELAARLPSFFASLVSVSLIFALGRRVYGRAVGVCAAWLLALSPFAILFSITVFIDPLLTAALLWAWWAAAAGRNRQAALAFSVAFAIKQTALLFLPVVLALNLLCLPASAGPASALRHLARVLRPLLLGLAITTIVVFAWDILRQPVIGFWSQGYSDNIPGRFVRAVEVVPRAQAWGGLLHYVAASRALNVVGLAALAALFAGGWKQPGPRPLADRLLAGFCLVYLGAYWLLAFNVWDRYLLPIVPLLFLLGARTLIWALQALRRAIPQPWLWPRRPGRAGLNSAIAGIVLILAALGPPALSAAGSKYPIGGDHGAYDGIDGAAEYLRDQPVGSVLYDHWLSWQWGFYLYDGPVYVSWFPSPADLATDLEVFGTTSPRFIAIPAWEGDAEVQAAVAGAGFSLEPVFTGYRRDGAETLRVYAIRPSLNE